MFASIRRLIKTAPIKPLIACTLATAVFGLTKVKLEELKPNMMENSIPNQAPSIEKMLKNIISREICDSKQIREG